MVLGKEEQEGTQIRALARRRELTQEYPAMSTEVNKAEPPGEVTGSCGLQLPALDSCYLMWQDTSSPSVSVPGPHPKYPASILRVRPIRV